MTIPSALGPLYAGFSVAHSRPINIVGLGSSTIDASGDPAEVRWFNKLIKHFQTLSNIEPSAVLRLTDSPNLTPGIHGYNGGQGGTTSRDYATDDRITRIKELQPVAVIHVVGSNDYARDISPTEYYNNISQRLDAIDAVMTRPYVNILVHAHTRGGSFKYSFNEYRSALHTISNQRFNVHFVNVEGPAYGAGIPDRDVFDLLHTDTTHLTHDGHDFFYHVMAEALTSQGYIPKVAPSPDNRGPQIIASDSFNVPNYTEVYGRTLNNALGGYTIKKWEVTGPKHLCAYYQRLCRLASATTTFFGGVKMDSPDQQLSAVLYHLPIDAPLYFAVRRQSNDIDPVPSAYCAILYPDGKLDLVRRIGRTVTVLATAPRKAVVGDRIVLSTKGDGISVFFSDVLVISANDSYITEPGYAGFSGSGKTHRFQLEDIVFARL